MSDDNPYGAKQNFNPDPGESPAQSAPVPDGAGPQQHPQRIGRYRIEKVLGKGGFGLVYLAHDEQLDRLVAIKIPHAKLISKPEDAEAYLVEARTVANLDYPGIVPVHDVGSTDEFPCYIVSKYVEGTDLTIRMKQSRLKHTATTELVATVAEALHYAHMQGLVHRDVKPGNILIGKDGQPYVVDFGLALREENIGKGPKYAGTPAYMSPEQARGEGHRVDGRSDIFSLGVVFYELLVGRQPFRGDTQAELFEQVTSYEPRPPRQYDDRIPKELERICLKALSKRATDRYTTAKDLAEDLRHFLTSPQHERESPSEWDSAQVVAKGRLSKQLGLSDQQTKVFCSTFLFADFKGYTERVRILEITAGHRAAAEMRRRVAQYIDDTFRQLEPEIDPDAYQLIDTAGDGFFFHFRQPQDAFQFAEALHKNTATHNAHVTDEIAEHWFRIGAATGEAAWDDSEPVGHVINVASRLQSASTGGDWVTDEATFAALPPEMQQQFDPQQTIYDKHDKSYEIHRTVFGRSLPPLSVSSSSSSTPPVSNVAPSSDSSVLYIVPKGLRSFDEHDADFFLELLPGPRDREGLPDSLRFWKTRIEETDADETFSVGLIYGPSGCGKSSLVKAGLLPRLSDDVISVYVESTPNETENRLLHGLRKHCPALQDNLNLQETLATLRRGQGVPTGKKVLIVLDQFEQWLHARKEEENTELVQALRQCDGQNVQCIVMVRDDFWLAISRFLRELEIRLVEGQNSALVDLFDLDHARKVLAAFGRSFGKLPEQTNETTKEQKDFLKQSVAGLVEEGKVICVRLALFAEMMKGKSWTPASLQAVGGTKGIGVNFLEETFSASTAPPEHRYHQKAARAVLGALLPDSGSNIKGHMRSYDELLDASGYAGRPQDFDDFIRVLDSEIRLITPTDPAGADDDSVSHVETGQKYYQLTHDYLVPSLHKWLTRKQQETRKGRAELKLEERSALWNAKPENRHLPTVAEWANIRTLTQKKSWTEPQREMMGKAGRVHGMRTSIALSFLIVATVIGVTIKRSVIEQQNITRAEGLVESLLKADTAQVPAIIADMKTYRKWANPKLTGAIDDFGETSQERLHASLALLPVDPTQVGYLKGRLLAADPEDIDVIRLALSDHKESILDDLWRIVEQPSKEEEPQLLQAASALALYDPENERWEPVADKVTKTVVNEEPFRVPNWTKLLQPIRGHLLESLGDVFRNRDSEFSQIQLDLATAILEQYAADDVERLAELILDAQPKQFVALFDEFEAHRSDGMEKLNNELDRTPRFQWSDEPLDPKWAKPDPSVVQRIEAANGTISERFAFCQTMPLEQFVEVAELLRSSSYRPTRFRPYAHQGSVQVAAVWTRDGRDWQLLHSMTPKAVRQRDSELRDDGFVPLDVAGYVQVTEEESAEQYGGIWVQRETDDEEALMDVGATSTESSTFLATNSEAGFTVRISQQAYRGLDGQQKYCGVLSKRDGTSHESLHTSPSDYEDKEYLDRISWDISISNAANTLTTKERSTQSLAAAETKLEVKEDDLIARHARGIAHFYLGNDEKAVEDMSFLIEKVPASSPPYQYRAVLYARMGNADQAEKDLAKFTELSNTASNKAYLDAMVAAYLGEDIAGMKRLEAFIEANKDDSGTLYDAACAYSIASNAFHDKDSAKSKVYSDRAVGLLKQAVSNGYTSYSHMETNADLDPIRDDADFQQIMAESRLDRRYLDRRYTAVWQTSVKYESQEIHGLSPKGQLERCRELIANGYRPVAISAASIGAKGEHVTASVWHRPLVPEDEKEQLAKRQANAAVALLKLGQSEKVWPLLKHSPDPRLRSWIIHRLSPLGASPDKIVKRLNEEPDVSIRRALILIVGEYDEGPQIDRNALSADLLEQYRDDPDPGIHGAVEWVLRRWGKGEEIAEINTQLATGTLEGERQWYVTQQGQTMVVIPGPVEFLMGSPATEKGRHSSEDLHRKRIGRSFAIASKEVTVMQFQKFLRNTPSVRHNYTKTYAPEENCPQTSVTWYQAAAYCRWLSEQEGVAEDQMCYPPIAEIKDGMKLPPDYLSRTGYRLPSEAEWEYACRSETVTSRYYGQTDELLGQYTWFIKVSNDRKWPVGSLKPNDMGLFDMYGNVWEWCQEERDVSYSESLGMVSEDREDNVPLRDSAGRLLRGGSFDDRMSFVRSAYRLTIRPSLPYEDDGFRPSRTYHLSP